MNGLQVRAVSQPPIIKGGYIFNTPEFQSLKPGEKKYFALFEKEQPIARISFSLNNHQAISGYQATFGSIDAEVPLLEETAKYFLEQACMSLESEGVVEVIIKHWPESYADSNKLFGIFREIGFKEIVSEINQHLVVQEEFKLLIRKNERKKLNQSIKQGYTFASLSVHDLADVYQLVTETRKRKGYPVSMVYDKLYQTIKLLPDNYLLFGLFDQGKLIAASVSILISQDILYNFYHADEISYRSTSPLVMLVQEIYHYCQQNDIKILDLGVSSENGLINQGLFNFKKNLGCVSSEKNTYRLKYA
jgi:hypothetical protein